MITPENAWIILAVATVVCTFGPIIVLFWKANQPEVIE